MFPQAHSQHSQSHKIKLKLNRRMKVSEASKAGPVAQPGRAADF